MSVYRFFFFSRQTARLFVFYCFWYRPQVFEVGPLFERNVEFAIVFWNFFLRRMPRKKCFQRTVVTIFSFSFEINQLLWLSLMYILIVKAVHFIVRVILFFHCLFYFLPNIYRWHCYYCYYAKVAVSRITNRVRIDRLFATRLTLRLTATYPTHGRKSRTLASIWPFRRCLAGLRVRS